MRSKLQTRARAVSKAVTVTGVILALIIGASVTYLLTVQGSGVNPLSGKTSLVVADSTYTNYSTRTNYSRVFSFIVPSNAKNAELKGSFDANDSISLYVFNLSNYTSYVQRGFSAAVPIYTSGYVPSNSFDFLVPAGNTYYIVLEQTYVNRNTHVSVRATLSYG